MIGHETVYAPAVDVISAVEMMHEGRNTEDRIFNADNAMSLINMGCIKDTDSVFILSLDADLITWITAYLYMPKRLIISKLAKADEEKEWISDAIEKWRGISSLLSGYSYTEPDFSFINIEECELEEKSYDVVIANIYTPGRSSEDKVFNRFCLDTGEEYELFEKTLKNTSKVVKKGGRMLFLAKPGWILKSWSLIHELGMQLEYLDYSLYLESFRYPNTPVWLRFSMVEEEFDVEKQKRNIVPLMEHNNVDRLFAHRNNLIFPYVELSYSNSEAYVEMDQNLQNMQYFFSLETTKNLAKLCTGYTACLVTPSIALCASEQNKNVVLFECDNRFRQSRNVKFVKYDLYTGLTEFTRRQYAKRFDVVLCDPPFDIKLDDLAFDIDELLKADKNSIAYVVFPEHRKASLISAMKLKGFALVDEESRMVIEYGKPPKLVRVYGKDAIQLFKFIYLN